MKIIKPGTNLAKWEMELECTGAGNGKTYRACGALLLVEEEDLYETQYVGVDGWKEVYVTFACAQCGTETDVDKKTIPDHVREKVLKKADWVYKQQQREEAEARKRSRIESNDK